MREIEVRPFKKNRLKSLEKEDKEQSETLLQKNYAKWVWMFLGNIEVMCCKVSPKNRIIEFCLTLRLSIYSDRSPEESKWWCHFEIWTICSSCAVSTIEGCTASAFSSSRFWFQELWHNSGKERKDYDGKGPFGKKTSLECEVIQIRISF